MRLALVRATFMRTAFVRSSLMRTTFVRAAFVRFVFVRFALTRFSFVRVGFVFALQAVLRLNSRKAGLGWLDWRDGRRSLRARLGDDWRDNRRRDGNLVVSAVAG